MWENLLAGTGTCGTAEKFHSADIQCRTMADMSFERPAQTNDLKTNLREEQIPGCERL